MHLAPNVYMARIDRRSIVLDLNRDRYIGLNAELSHALHSLSSSPDEDRQVLKDSGTTAKLLRHGLLSSQGETNARRISKPAKEPKANIPRPTSSLWALLSDERTSKDPISYAGMTSALVSLTQVAISLRLRSFKSTIDWLAKTKIAAHRDQANWSAQNLVNFFYEVRPYFPLKPICRLDAMSLCLYLRRNGQQAALVFGVRLDPFAAHCWVQISDVVIDEAWARVRQYTPILIV